MPQRRYWSLPDLSTLIAIRLILAARRWAFSNLYYSAGPLSVTIPGYTWIKGPTFDQDKAKAVAHWKTGLDVDQWQVVIAPRLINPLTNAPDPDMIGTQPWLAAAQAGALNGAQVQVNRAIGVAPFPTSGSFIPVGIVAIFSGRIAEVDVGRSQVVITLRSPLKVLTNPLPRNLWQASCVWTLYDAGCFLNAANFSVNGTVTGGNGTTFLSPVSAPPGSATYTLGRITMTSGASLGFTRTIRMWTPGTFTLIAPLPFGFAINDTFTAAAGCNKTYGQCAQFNNQSNFGGCLSIPVPETAV